jgi:N-acetylneuraminic acid mutarotase
MVAYYSGDATFAASSSNAVNALNQQLAIGVGGDLGGLGIRVLDTATGLPIPDATVLVNGSPAPYTYWDGGYFYSIAYSPPKASGAPFNVTVTTVRGQVATVTGTFVGVPQINTPGSGTNFVAANPLTVSWTPVAETYTLETNCYPTSCFTVVPVDVSAPLTSYQYPANTFAVGGSVNFYLTARSALTYVGATVHPSYAPYLQSITATSLAYPVLPPPVATTTTISTSGQVLVNGPTGVTLNATVASGGSPLGLGAVSFFSGSTLIGTSIVTTAGTANLTMTAPSIYGLQSLTAQFQGTTTYAPSTSAALSQWVILPPVPTNRIGPGAAAVGGKFYLMGGYEATYYKSVDVYDPAARTWSTANPMAYDHYFFQPVVLNGKIYAVGGDNYGGNHVEVFDPITGNWSNVGSLNVGRKSLGAAVANGKIYAMGGYSPTTNAYVTEVEEYDPGLDTWTVLTGRDIPHARANLQVQAVGGKIYAIGGWQNPRADGNAGAVNFVDEFDPVPGIWTSRAPIPSARDGFASAVINNRIYAFDGRDGVPPPSTAAIASVESYDPLSNTWTVHTAPQVQRFDLAGAEINGTVYLGGGLVRGSVFPPGPYWWGTLNGINITATAFEPYTP